VGTSVSIERRPRRALPLSLPQHSLLPSARGGLQEKGAFTYDEKRGREAGKDENEKASKSAFGSILPSSSSSSLPSSEICRDRGGRRRRRKEGKRARAAKHKSLSSGPP